MKHRVCEKNSIFRTSARTNIKNPPYSFGRGNTVQMSKIPYCDPNQVTIPASGGQIKFRLKNPDTKKFLYQVHRFSFELKAITLVKYPLQTARLRKLFVR